MVIKISKKMDTAAGFENKLIRIPKHLRAQLGVFLGEFINLGENLILQVDMPFKEDIITYGSNMAFVTEDVFNILRTDNIDDVSITEKITLGCDPELFIINTTTNKLIDPNHLFQKWSPIGTDGLLCELRPNPHTDSKIVINNIFKMLRTVQNKFHAENLTNLMMYGSSSAYKLAAGFHCHMGIPQKLLDKRALNYTKLINVIVMVLNIIKKLK